MISKEKIEVLKIIAQNLKPHGINWALVGSSNLALQGVSVEAHDIDIITDKEGALSIGKVLHEYVEEEVKYKESEKFKSYYGKFNINGVHVEIIGNLLNKSPRGDLWSETTNLSKKEIFKLDNLEIPVISLDQEYKAYLKLGREEKAEKIVERINSKRGT
ncbi:MAG: hypothetical protein AAB782_01340 [Patescibacteria group bacterium]|mgnify:CR=1 FL=1